MALHPSRRAYGFEDTDERLVRFVDHLARQHKLTFAQREALDAFYHSEVVKRGRTADADLLTDFVNYTEARGISFEVAETIALEVLTAGERGVVPDFPSPTLSEDRATIERAQEAMRSDPNGWDHDIEAQRNYFDALERQSVAPDKSAPLGEEVNTLPTHAANAKNRAAEIAEILRTDAPRYFSDKGMQREFAALSGASAWGLAPESSPEPSPTPQQGDQ